VLAVDPVRALGDLDDQHGAGGVPVAVGVRFAGHHGDVGLGLGVVIERDRKLRVDLPNVAKDAAQRGQYTADRGRVAAALRFSDHEQAVQQLQALAGLEHSQLDQTLVLSASPASGPGRRDCRGIHRSQA